MGGPYQESGLGLDIDLATYGAPLSALDLLFSESQARAVITCARDHAAAVVALADALGVPAFRAGTVKERGEAVRIRLRDAIVEYPVGHLREVYFAAIPRRMGD
jgi:phosphoribosylformylglycinamidine (FGAM) synthase-like enzyme